MLVAVHAAAGPAAAGGRHIAVVQRLQRVLASAFGLAPGGKTAVAAHGRPVGHGRWHGVVVVLLEAARAKYHAAADHRHVRGEEGDIVFWHLEVVLVGHDHVGELAHLDAATLVHFVAEPGDVLGPHAQGGFTVEQVALGVHLGAADGLAGDHPRDRHPGVVRGDARGIGTGRDFDAALQNLLDRWRGLGGLGAIALDKVFALVGHAVLHGDAAAHGRNTVDGFVGNGFGVVKEPVQAVDGRLFVHLLEHIERAADGFVVGRVQAPWPFVLHQDAHHFFQVAFHIGRHVGARLAEVLKVGRRINQHFARAVVAEVVVALFVFHALRPGQKVFFFFLGLLREQVVGQAHGDLAVLVELLDDFVVVRVVLRAATGVDHTSHAQAVQLAHEVARGVELVIERQLGAQRQRVVEDGGIGLGYQEANRVAAGIAHDLATGRLRRVLVIAHGAQGGGVEQGAVIQVQQEHGRIRRHRIDFFKRRQTLFHKLVLGKATHHAHPLRCRRVGHLRLEHGHGIGQRAHAVPAQLQVVVQAATDHVGVIVEQAGQHAALLQIDLARAAAGQGQHFGVGAHGDELAVLHRHGIGLGLAFVQGGDAAIVKNDIRCGVRHGCSLRRVGCRTATHQPAGSQAGS